MEVKLTEIRFGNTIAITDRPIKEDYRMVDLKMMSAIAGGLQMYGIPTTPATLEMFGFKFTDAWKYDLGEISIIFPRYSNPDGCVYFKSFPIILKVPPFVHDIENLHLLLTGTELKLVS